MRAKTPARLSLFLLVPVLALSGLGSAGPLGPRQDVAVAPVMAAVEAGTPTDAPTAPTDDPATPTEAPTTPTEAPATPTEAPATPTETPSAEASAADEPARKPAVGKRKAQQAEEPEQAAAAAAPAAADVSPRTLYLAIGHGRQPNGRWDPGAENQATGAFEVDAATIMVEAMVEVLEDAPNLELTFESGDHPNVLGSVAAANAAGVDDCIEVHQDSAVAPSGAFAHWYPGAGSAQTLADQMIRGIREAGVKTRTDWHRPRPGLYWLRKSDCRAVLLEIGRVGDFDAETLQVLGRNLARTYLANTARARGVATG